MKQLVSLLLVTMLLPALLYSSGLASSLGIGTMIGAGLILFTWFVQNRSLRRLRKGFVVAIVVSALLTIHLMLADGLVHVDFVRGLSSIAGLFVVIVAASALSGMLAASTDTQMRHLVGAVFVSLVVLGALGGFHILQPFDSRFFKSVFPFSEPSHFALAITPFAIAACSLSRSLSRRLIAMGLVLGEGLMLNSLLLVVSAIIIALVSMRKRQALVAVLLASGVMLLTSLSWEYYSSRLEISTQSSNASVLVYIQGWEQIWAALRNTSGFGLGFQQLGISGADVPITQRIIDVVGHEQNALDGGFTAAKLIGELGTFGVVIVGAYLWLFFYALGVLRRASLRSNRVESEISVFCASCVAGLSLELFLRGSGYFTPTVLLSLASAALLLRRRRADRRAKRVGCYATRSEFLC